MYKIQREIASILQDNNNLVTYFNRLKRLWEDQNVLRPLPYCECGGCKCGVLKKFAEIYSSIKTIQFLMGLNEGFDAVRNHILLQEPLPSANKVYGMLQNVKSQKAVHKTFEDVLESSAMLVKTQLWEKQ